MNNFFASTILLGFMMVFVVGLTMFNINQTRNVLETQTNLQSKIDNLKNESNEIAMNLGDLMDLGIEPIGTESTDAKVVDNSQTVTSQNEATLNAAGKTTGTVPDKTKMPTKEEITAILSKAPSIELSSPEGTLAVGKAATAVYDNKTYHKIAAINMPNLSMNQYFSAWLIDDTKESDPILMGKMNYEASTSNATLLFMAEGDLSAYKKVVVTLESGETSSEVAPLYVLQGRFEDSVNFKVDMPKPVVEPSAKAPAMNQQNIQSMLESLKGSGDVSKMLGGASLGDALGSGASMQDLLEALKK